MERCIRCEAEGRNSTIKGLSHEVIGPNGLRMVLCNICYTVFKDEVGGIDNFAIYENEED